MNGGKVSIVIPAYNAEKFIKRAIDSCISQSHKDIEIIVVDDGSIDGTSSVVSRYEHVDKRIKLLNKENGGVSSARNLGIREASGDYLVFFG